MQFAPGIHDLVGDQIVRLIIKLLLCYHTAPFSFTSIIKGNDSNIICLVAYILVITPAVPPVTVIIRRIIIIIIRPQERRTIEIILAVPGIAS